MLVQTAVKFLHFIENIFWSRLTLFNLDLSICYMLELSFLKIVAVLG